MFVFIFSLFAQWSGADFSGSADPYAQSQPPTPAPSVPFVAQAIPDAWQPPAPPPAPPPPAPAPDFADDLVPVPEPKHMDDPRDPAPPTVAPPKLLEVRPPEQRGSNGEVTGSKGELMGSKGEVMGSKGEVRGSKGFEWRTANDNPAVELWGAVDQHGVFRWTQWRWRMAPATGLYRGFPAWSAPMPSCPGGQCSRTWRFW